MDEASLVSKSDEELMQYYQAGEQVAFEILFKRHAGRVLGFLTKRLAQKQAAHDLTQEVFLKLHRSRAQYVADFAFAPWLFAITRNVWIDHLKKNSKEVPARQDFLEILSPPAEPVLVTRDDNLEGLPPRYKVAVTMKIYDDATFEEIARRLATTSENARQLVSRGIKRLREMITKKRGRNANDGK